MDTDNHYSMVLRIHYGAYAVGMQSSVYVFGICPIESIRPTVVDIQQYIPIGFCIAHYQSDVAVQCRLPTLVLGIAIYHLFSAQDREMVYFRQSTAPLRVDDYISIDSGTDRSCSALHLLFSPIS